MEKYKLDRIEILKGDLFDYKEEISSAIYTIELAVKDIRQIEARILEVEKELLELEK